jgi:hypothetical protein
VTLNTAIALHTAMHQFALSAAGPAQQQQILAKGMQFLALRKRWRSQELPLIIADSVSNLRLHQQTEPPE